MCRVTFLALLTRSSCCVLRAIGYTMGLRLLQLIYESACVRPVKPSCRKGLKPLKMVCVGFPRSCFPVQTEV